MDITFRLKDLVFIVGVILLGIALVTVETRRPERSEKKNRLAIPEIGAIAPPFRLNDLNGKQRSLKDFAGQVVLINFWATWCGPCKAEMSSMESLYREYRDQGFVILALSVDFEGEEAVRPFAEAMNFSFPILLDQDLEVEEQYRIYTVPTSLVIDRDGIITQKIIGQRDWNSLPVHAMIKELLGEGI